MDQEIQTCARNLRLDLSRMPGCCSGLITAPNAEQKIGFTPSLQETIFPFRCINNTLYFQAAFCSTYSFPLDHFHFIWVLLQSCGLLCHCRHAFSFAAACQKTFSPQEAFVRTHSGSCNSFIAGSHLWLNSFKACTGMSINLSIWIQINRVLLSAYLFFSHASVQYWAIQTVCWIFHCQEGFKVSIPHNASSFFLLLWPGGGKMECQLFNHPESKRWTQCNHVRMN